MEDLIKNHSHNGLDSKKINASSIEVNSNKFKTNRLEDVILEIYEKVEKKLEIDVKGNGFLKVEGKKIVDSNFNSDSFALKDYIHNEYLKKIENKKNGDIVVIKNDGLEDSNISIKDIVLKDEISNKLDKVNVKENNIVIGSKDGIIDSNVNINDLEVKNHKHNEYFEIDEKIKDNSILIKDKNKIVGWKDVDQVALKNHIHNEYEKKVFGEVGNVVIRGKDGLEVADIKLSDLVLRNELNKKINGEDGSILILSKGEIKSSDLNKDIICKKEHKHKVEDITGIKNWSKEEIISIVRDEIKKVLEEVLNDIFKRG